MDNYFFQEARRDYEDFMRQYGDEMEAEEKQHKEDDLRMKYGKDWKKYRSEKTAPKPRRRAYPLPKKKK